MKRRIINEVTEMRAEYDFDYSKAERGRYYKRLLKEGSNVVVLEPDVHKRFKNSNAVNMALRSLIRAEGGVRRSTRRSTRTRRRTARASSR